MDSFQNIIVYLYRYLVIPLYVLGNVGNFFTALIFFRKAWRKNVCVFYLTICLLFDVLNINSSILGYIFINAFNINLHNSHIILCKLYNYLTFPSTVLVLASIDRLLISSQNIDTRLYSSKRLAFFSLSINTLFWLIFYVHVLIKFNIDQFGSSVFICFFDTNGFYPDFLSYSFLFNNVSLFIIMIVLSIFSFKNVRQIRSVSREHRRHVRSMHKKDFQLLRCLYIQDIVYIICNSSLITYVIYKAMIKYQLRSPSEQALDNFLFNLCILIRHIPFCIRFIIYISVSKAFRQEFQRFVYAICNKHQPVLAQEIEHQNNVELNVVSTIHLTR